MALRIIHFGVGGRGQHWIEFASENRGVESVACVDVDQEALQAAGEQLGCKTFTSLQDALTGVQAEGVIIASPSFLHGQHAMEAIDAGLAVMVEKPLAGSLREAVDVVQRAREAGRPLMVAENYRFFRAERTLRHFIDSGTPGVVRRAVCVDRRNQPSDTQGGWVKKMEQPFLTEIAVHHFDSFRYLFDRQPVALWSRASNPVGSDYDQNASAETLLEMDGGLFIQYSGSFIGSRYEYSLSVETDNGEIRTDRSRVWWRSRGERKFKQVDPVAMPDGEALRYPHAGMLSMMGQFRAAIDSGTVPETSGADNLWTLAMFEAAVTSTATGNYVATDEVFTAELQARAGVSRHSETP